MSYLAEKVTGFTTGHKSTTTIGTTTTTEKGHHCGTTIPQRLRCVHTSFTLSGVVNFTILIQHWQGKDLPSSTTVI